MKKKIAVLSCGWSFYFLNSFIQGMQKATKDKDTDIYFFNAYNFTEFSGYPNNTGFSVFNLINYEEYDGIIILADLIQNFRILEKERLKIVKSGKPAISINHKMNGISCIQVDNYTGFYELLEHLVKDHKLRDFIYLAGSETSLDFAERKKAFRNILSDYNIPIDIEKMISLETSDFNSGYKYMSDFLNEGKDLPEAFICANDMIAWGVIKACEERDVKIPEQVKVVGFDDVSYSKMITPSLTTVRGNAEQIGFEAVNRVLSGKNDLVALKMKSTPIFRNSCGCEASAVQTRHTNLEFLTNLNKNSEFNGQIEKIEEIFTEAADVFTLLTNLEIFFSKSHHFEGKDFCIFLKSDWSSVLINSEENLPQNLSYGQGVQSIVSIQNDKKYAREFISTRELIPSKLNTEGSNFYLFMPIYHHLYVHGYYVCKNNTALIDNFFGYTWTKTFGTSIERFRKKNMYKQMGQQYLKLSTRDALSGMLNRIGLEKLAKPFYAENRKNGLTTVLFFVDINSMKTINDKFGHLHGDLAVKTIAAAVLEVIPKNWLGIRYGGDEFLVVGNSKNYNGEDYCQLITLRIAQKTSVMHLPYNLSASLGALSVPPNSEMTLEDAIHEVDEIMYKNKQDYHKTH